jgi:CheY-like chemotaxis protein
MTTKRIMIVDDEPAFTRLLKRSLEQEGEFAVCVENNPRNAVQAAQQFQPDLILLDVMMPGMDGGELAERFETTGCVGKVPIVFLTAAVMREEVNRNHGEIGGHAFLAKPVDLSELTQCIRQHLPAG